MTQIVVAAPIRNESRRFLQRWLDTVLKFADRVIVLDDASEDDTAQSCRQRGDRVIVHSLSEPSLLHNETRTRATLWEHVRGVAKPGDWLALLDADEIPSAHLILQMDTIRALPRTVQRLDAKLAEMWTDTHFRVDGLWSPWITFFIRYEDMPFHATPDAGAILHAPRLPEYAQLFQPHPLDAPVLHLGYSRPELRVDKARYYLAHNTGINLTHAHTILEKPELSPLSVLLDLPHVVVTVPIRNRSWVVSALTRNLDELNYPQERLRIRFVLNNSVDETEDLLLAWKQNRKHIEVVRTDLPDSPPPGEHQWWGPAHDPDGPLRRMAKLRNGMLEHLCESGAEAMLAVDSDVLLNPGTLRHLAATGADIISPVFWASWGLQMGPLFQGLRNVVGRPDVNRILNDSNRGKRPQVWERGVSTSSETFLMDLIVRRGLHRVGGLGGVTFIRKAVPQAGVNYDNVPNLPEDYWGEDRHFCVRAVCHGFRLWASSYLPVVHRDGPNDDVVVDQ